LQVGYLDPDVYGIRGVEQSGELTYTIFEISSAYQRLAGWGFDHNSLYSISYGTVDNPGNGVLITASNPAIKVYEGTDLRLEMGYLATDVYGIRGWEQSGGFSYTIFELSSQYQRIGGWLFDRAHIYSVKLGTISNPGNGIVIDSDTPLITLYEGLAKRVDLGYIVDDDVYGLKLYGADGVSVIFEASGLQQVIAGWGFSTTNLQSLSSGAGIDMDSAAPSISLTDGSVDRVYMGRSGTDYVFQIRDEYGVILFDAIGGGETPYLKDYADSKAVELELMKINFQNISWAQFAVFDEFSGETKRSSPDPSTYPAVVYKSYLYNGDDFTASKSFGFVSKTYTAITTVESGLSSSVGSGFLTDSSKNWFTNQMKNLTLKDSSDNTFTVLSNTSDTLTVSGSPSAGAYSLIDNDPAYAVAFCSLDDSDSGGYGTVLMEVSFDGGSHYQTFYQTGVVDSRQGTVEIDNPGTDYIVRLTLTNDGAGNGPFVYKFLVCTDPSPWRF
jgi:hypothetical protein